MNEYSFNGELLGFTTQFVASTHNVFRLRFTKQTHKLELWNKIRIALRSPHIFENANAKWGKITKKKRKKGIESRSFGHMWCHAWICVFSPIFSQSVCLCVVPVCSCVLLEIALFVLFLFLFIHFAESFCLLLFLFSSLFSLPHSQFLILFGFVILFHITKKM